VRSIMGVEEEKTGERWGYGCSLLVILYV